MYCIWGNFRSAEILGFVLLNLKNIILMKSLPAFRIFK